MPRDYKSRSRRNEPESEGPSAIVWLFVGILIGLIISGIFYLKGQHHATPLTPERHAEVKKLAPAKKPEEKTSAQKQAQTAAEESKPNSQNTQNLQTQFDFYNVLPNKNQGKTTQPQSSQPQTAQPQTAAPAQKTAVASTTSPSPVNYVVQIATLSKPSDADQLKAQLLLLGFDVNVTPAQKNGQTLQRVWLGPFTNKSDATATQKQLQQNQISSNLLKSTS
jgi:cell division protein FtsN